MGSFNEHDQFGKDILACFEFMLFLMQARFGFRYGSPYQDVARRLLNEIMEYEHFTGGE